MLETQHLRELPFSIDYRRLGSLLDRLAQSRLLLVFLKKELERIGSPRNDKTVCVFGSVSRGEMDVLFSDIDMMFIGFSKKERAKVLKELAGCNRAFDFHGALELLGADGASAREHLETRFPCIGPTELCADNEKARRRRLQVLLESIPVSGDTAHQRVVRDIVRYYDLEPRPKLRETPQRFITEMEEFFDKMKSDTAGSRHKQSDFFAKYLLVREIGQHFTRLGLVRAIFSKRRVLDARSPATEFAHLLRDPSLSKILFWASPMFLSGRTVSMLVSQHGDELKHLLREEIRNARLDSRVEWPRNFQLDELVRTVTLGIACSYTGALDLLHAPALRKHLRKSPTNIVNWRSDKQLNQVSAQIEKMVVELRLLGIIIASLFSLAEKHGVFTRPYKGSGLEASLKYFLTHLSP